MSALPRPSDLGAIAMATLRDELIPALPAHLRYSAAMTARALDYALTHTDTPDPADTAAAADLVRRIARGEADNILPDLEAYLTRERAKVAPPPRKDPRP